VANYFRKKSDKGFTIVEIMIVLAIAGLIVLIVFLAVPSLQRQSRNQRRRADLGRMYASITEYQSQKYGVQLAPFQAPRAEATDALSQQAFDGFIDEYLGEHYDQYTFHRRSWTSSHAYTVNVDEIYYHPSHWCNDGSYPPQNVVMSTTHQDHTFAISIGMEDGFYYCLDNGTGN
jgi:prepilin-type N-terminal cleavage/methylation domain-containing protein